MPDIAALKARYFLNAADVNLPSEPLPSQFDDCKITPLIDASRYNSELEAALALVGTGPDAASNVGHFILIHNWCLGLAGGSFQGKEGFGGSEGPIVVPTDPYYLDGVPDAGPPPSGGTRKLIDILKEKARRGVEVRVLGWISIGIMGNSVYHLLGNFFAYTTKLVSAIISHTDTNAATMLAIKNLRADETLRPHLNAVLNTIGHTAGGAHTKLVVIGTNAKAVGFTGGLDFLNSRWAHPYHPTMKDGWHDVMAKVEGPAVQALYDWFQMLWSENLKRPVTRFQFQGDVMPSFLPRTPVLQARILPLDPQPDNHSVQSLRTVPRFNYKWYNCLPENPPVSFAPKGLFEIRAGLRKALRAADTYIYMEDQAFWSREVFSWINEAIRTKPNLRVLLLTSGSADPNDPQFAEGNLTGAINQNLLAGLTPAQVNCVRFFKRMLGYISLTFEVISVASVGGRCELTLNQIAKNAVPANIIGNQDLYLVADGERRRIVGNPAIPTNSPIVLVMESIGGECVPAGIYQFVKRLGVTIHAKTTLIDDAWAFIGSANVLRRSLYTDIEHGVAVLDPGGTLVRDYRTALWSDHFRHGIPSDFNNIQEGLNAWEPSWGVPGAPPRRPELIVPIPLPMSPDPPLTDQQKTKYDNYEDLDSRDAWGGLCP